MKVIPKNVKCIKCDNKQYTNESCKKCGGKAFVDLKEEEKITLALTDEELDIIVNWGFIVSTLKPLSEKDRELYFKITNG